jgi:hypothetical protein
MNDGRQGTWITTPSGMTTVDAGAMHAVTTSGDWASTGTVIANTMCYDASRYTGIQFKVKSATNRSLLFIVQTPETAADFSHMRASVTIPTDFMTVQVPFSTLMKAGFGAGSMLPADYKAQTRMTGIAFGVGTQTEKLDLFVDDVAFY